MRRALIRVSSGARGGIPHPTLLSRKFIPPFLPTFFISSDELEYSYPRIIFKTSSLFSSIISFVFASRLRRRTGSVLEGRTLSHQSGYSIFTPSISLIFPSAYFSLSAVITLSLSSTSLLISPEWKYLLTSRTISDIFLPVSAMSIQKHDRRQR